ncbi:DUF1413 domain-containing protein [Photobacterium toruni]|uniref:Uncharacterized protein n=1 Tax=Photobacterium toruni TaxID=1935446 RepID=A0A1T4UUU2_9GAMM|nr:DUF1413 domain-containing protein [Photobacterium toruni]SKA56388.1 hypothetical protein CZ814_03744 [Photobacterium toruni]
MQNLTPVTIRLNNELAKQYSNYAASHNISRQDLIAKILNDWMSNQTNESSEINSIDDHCLSVPNDIIQTINSNIDQLQINTETSLKKLVGEKWNDIPITIRRTLGKNFLISVNNNQFNLKPTRKKTNNEQQYAKKS